MVGPGVAIAVIMRRGVSTSSGITNAVDSGPLWCRGRWRSSATARSQRRRSAWFTRDIRGCQWSVRAYDLRGYFSHLLHTARINPRFYKLFPRRYHRAGGIKYLRVLASGAPARRSQAVSGALCESQRRSHQRDGARDFVSGPRAPNQRPCSHQARLHRSLPRRRESNLSPPIWDAAFAGVRQ